jgi:hypothetical protein
MGWLLLSFSNEYMYFAFYAFSSASPENLDHVSMDALGHFYFSAPRRLIQERYIHSKHHASSFQMEECFEYKDRIGFLPQISCIGTLTKPPIQNDDMLSLWTKVFSNILSLVPADVSNVNICTGNLVFGVIFVDLKIRTRHL